MSLPRKYCLSSKSEIEGVFKKGKYLNSELFSIKFSPNSTNFSRLAVIVGKKSSKKSVLRNRIKRLVSEIIRLNYSRIKPGYNIVLIVKSRAINEEYRDLKEALVKRLSEIG